MARKGNRVQVILECTEHKATGLAGTSRYITVKNKKNTPERMELKKFNPIMKKVTPNKNSSNAINEPRTAMITTVTPAYPNDFKNISGKSIKAAKVITIVKPE